MIPLVVRGVAIGEGIPKICVSLTSKTRADLIEDAEACVGASNVVDLIEWRADYYEALQVSDALTVSELNAIQTQILGTLAELRRIIGDKPLLFTYRTRHEGGSGKDTKKEVYIACLKIAIASGLIDLVDVELFTGDEIMVALIAFAHAHAVKVIASNHDFVGTPNLDEIVTRLQKMQTLGADILKIAVMPHDKKDVLTLLEATVTMSEHYADRPIVTIAMSDLGAISRVTGEVFGSAITFGQLGKMSASGQIEASRLSDLQNRLHQLLSIENKL